jgi:hypothetical protein
MLVSYQYLQSQEMNLDLFKYQEHNIVQPVVTLVQLDLIPQPAVILVYLVMFTYLLTIPVPLLAQAHSSESIQLTHVRTVMLRA